MKPERNSSNLELYLAEYRRGGPDPDDPDSDSYQDEEVSLRERDRYELVKGRLIREMKRVRDEDGSCFNNFQILNHRYALLNLLGKGGFSEVYTLQGICEDILFCSDFEVGTFKQAYDLVEHRYVACKLHGLNAQWSEQKKQSSRIQHSQVSGASSHCASVGHL